MKPTGKMAQPENLLGRERLRERDTRCQGRLAPPFGELYVDEQGNPLAVVCCMHRRKKNDYPSIPGLSMKVEEGPQGLVSVTYTREGEPQ